MSDSTLAFDFDPGIKRQGFLVLALLKLDAPMNTGLHVYEVVSNRNHVL